MDKLYSAGVRRFFVMGAPPLHDAPTMRVMAPSPAASDLGRLAAFGLQTSLDAQSQVLPFLCWANIASHIYGGFLGRGPPAMHVEARIMAASSLGRPGRA